LPFNEAQVQMAREDNVGDVTELLADFEVRLSPFAEAVKSYASNL
jgi:hypothetical protein